MSSQQQNVVIIGAGPAGLAIAGRLRQAGIEFKILEKTANVGESWRNHYDRLHLHSVKRLSHLPHMPFPDDYPVYVPRAKFVEYLEDYARKFKIDAAFNTEVLRVRRASGNHKEWVVETNSGEVVADHVVVATGVNAVPVSPEWPGMQEFRGAIVHSRDYRNPAPFKSSKTLVIGMGNTGAELALDLAEHGVETYISVRSPVNIVPRDLNGRPVQETALILDKIPFGLGEWLGAKIQGIYFGDLSKYGLEKSTVRPAVQLMETGKTPVIDIGTVSAIKRGDITVVGDVQKFIEDGVVLSDGTELQVDQVVLATGYRSSVSSLVERMAEWLDDLGYPKGPVGQGYHDGIYFVGFNNYELGGILGTIFKDSEEVCTALQENSGVVEVDQ